MKTTADVWGNTKDWIWLKIPELWKNKILTLPHSILPRGTQQCVRGDVLIVTVDESSLRYGDGHTTADLEVHSLVGGIKQYGTRTPEGDRSSDS